MQSANGEQTLSAKELAVNVPLLANVTSNGLLENAVKLFTVTVMG